MKLIDPAGDIFASQAVNAAASVTTKLCVDGYDEITIMGQTNSTAPDMTLEVKGYRDASGTNVQDEILATEKAENPSIPLDCTPYYYISVIATNGNGAQKTLAAQYLAR